MSNQITKTEALRFISEITHAVNQGGDPEAILERILSACIQTTYAESGSIMLIDEDGENLTIRCSQGLPPEFGRLKLKMGEGVTGRVARSGKARIVGDAASETDYIPLKEGLCSELAVPMIVSGIVIGVISVDSTAKEAFDRDHEQFLSIMSNLATRIFVDFKDNQILKNRDRFHLVLHEISRVVSGSLNLEDVFREVMTITEKAFRLHRSTLLLYDRSLDQLRIAASVGFTKDELVDVTYSPGEGITGSVFLNKKPVYIPSVSNEPGFLNRMKTYAGTGDMGFFCCPIFSGADVVGVFSTFTRQQGLDADSMIEFLEILGSMISQAITIQRLVKEETRVIASENIELKRELSARYKFGSLIGRAPPMLRLFEKVRIIADSRASVLLTGESGTGKELIASAIHYNSPRKDQPFVKINCAAIPENLLESELFGHRKGSFTGAIADKKGKFETADGGSIFLDEIGELDLNLQSKLLRVLQEREIEPVGGRTRQVDIRIIAATNADLEVAIAEKRFRADLFYRLNVINLKIPPLRERKEDVLLLVTHFIEKYNKENGKEINGISHAALKMIEDYEWPGNVRQLENAVERAIVLSRNKILDVDDFVDTTLPFSQQAPAVQAAPAPVASQSRSFDLPEEDSFRDMDGQVYDTVIAEVERRLILHALKKFKYTKTQAARYLGINRNTLDKKIRELAIDY